MISCGSDKDKLTGSICIEDEIKRCIIEKVKDRGLVVEALDNSIMSCGAKVGSSWN